MQLGMQLKWVLLDYTDCVVAAPRRQRRLHGEAATLTQITLPSPPLVHLDQNLEGRSGIHGAGGDGAQLDGGGGGRDAAADAPGPGRPLLLADASAGGASTSVTAI
nr:unnamed protein product [Digitaria exilis]